MENLLQYGNFALSIVLLVLAILILKKITSVHYLLEQPIVKKLAPQLKLKPVKLEDAIDRNRHQHGRAPNSSEGPNQHQRNNGQNGSRPQGERNDQDRRPDANRNGPERTDRRPERDGDRNRNDRFKDRDRNRNDRPNGDRNRPPQNQNNGASKPTQESAPSSIPQQEMARAENVPSPASTASTQAPLAPRRPLLTTPQDTESRNEISAVSTVPVESPSEGNFNSDDVQHGRRTQLKKKPRFEMEEEKVDSTVEG